MTTTPTQHTAPVDAVAELREALKQSVELPANSLVKNQLTYTVRKLFPALLDELEQARAVFRANDENGVNIICEPGITMVELDDGLMIVVFCNDEEREIKLGPFKNCDEALTFLRSPAGKSAVEKAKGGIP